MLLDMIKECILGHCLLASCFSSNDFETSGIISHISVFHNHWSHREYVERYFWICLENKKNHETYPLTKISLLNKTRHKFC